MRLQSGISLRAFNTFGIDATAKHFAAVHDLEACRTLVRDPVFHSERRLVLGGGSNILFTGDFDGLVIHVALRGIDLLREDASHVWLRVAAGEVWHAVVQWSVERGLGGLENLALIPGLAGAAPIQNIGAYGAEMRDTCEAVETLALEAGEPAYFPAAACEFGYRDSIFKRRERGRHLVTAVHFRLQKQPQLRLDYGDLRATLREMGVESPTARDVCAAVSHIRTAKLPDPRQLGNAGSFFKNPVVSAEMAARLRAEFPAAPVYPQTDGSVKLAAGWLIEQCGWKGKQVGRAGVHARQALVLVNQGGASGGEILALADAIRASVRERFQIDLVPEVEVV
jgi:UDP-N-acetylmuramate dehydrogenase